MQYIFCSFLGLLFTFAFAPFNLFIFAPIALAGIYYYAIDKVTCGSEILKKVTCFGFFHYLSSMYWLAAPLFVDIKSYYFVLPFSLILAPLVLSLFISIPALIAHVIGRDRRGIKIIVFASSITVMELLRTFVIPFPWNLIGYSSDGFLALMQAVRIITIHGLGFIIVFSSIGIFSKIRGIVIVSSSLFLGCIVFGFVRIWTFENTIKSSTKESYSIRIVQPNYGYFINDTYDERYSKLEQLIELILQDLPKDNRLIVLPEGSIAFGIMDEEDIVVNILKNIAITNETAIIFNIAYLKSDDEYYNSAIFINSEGEKDIYYKNILVPFGEYIPFSSFLGGLISSPVVSNGKSFNSGNEKKLFLVENENFFASICFEVIFSQFFCTTKGSNIINLTNDSWLGRTIGPYQHFSMSKFRAIENNSYLIRSANTGISGFIDPLGRALYSTKLFEKSIIDVVVN